MKVRRENLKGYAEIDPKYWRTCDGCDGPRGGLPTPIISIEPEARSAGLWLCRECAESMVRQVNKRLEVEPSHRHTGRQRMSKPLSTVMRETARQYHDAGERSGREDFLAFAGQVERPDRIAMAAAVVIDELADDRTYTDGEAAAINDLCDTLHP